MNKLPKIYKNQELKKVKNNKEVFDSLKDKVTKKDINLKKDSYKKELKKNLTVKDKIKELVNQDSYIFNTKVKITLENKEIECQIAGIVNNHVITMNNEIIKIDDILKLEILE